MTTADSLLADQILASPAVTRLALSAPSPRLREQAAHELAQLLLATLEGSAPAQDRRQMTLPL